MHSSGELQKNNLATIKFDSSSQVLLKIGEEEKKTQNTQNKKFFNVGKNIVYLRKRLKY